MNDKFDEAEKTANKVKIIEDLRHNQQLVGNVGQMLGDIAGMMNQGSGPWKMMKIAETKITMLQGVMNAVASAMELGFPQNVIVGASLTASVLAQGMSNIRQITSTEIPTIPEQYYTGGFNVKGGIDGKTYNATFSNQSGGYVGSENPNVVLGGEKGEEYWMNADMLRNPVMADIAHAMEAYRTNKIAIPDFNNIVSTITTNRQMKSGGYTSSSTWKGNPTPGTVAVENNETVILLREIADKLGHPVPAIFDYDYYTEEIEFMNSIKDIARG